MRLVVAVFFAMSSCALLTDVDGLATDAGGESGADATTDAPDEASGDASTDVAVEAEAGPFCAPYAEAGVLVYCQDFDAPDAAALAFLTSGTGAAAVDTSDDLSPPASLLTSVAVSDAGTAHAYSNHVMSVAPSTATLSFDMKVVTLGAPYLDIVELVFAETTGTRDLILQIDPTGMTVEEEYPLDAGFTTLSHPHIGFAWGNGWHHVVVTANLSGTTKTSSLVIDSQTLEANYALFPGWTPALFNVAIGVTFAPTSPSAWAVRFDDELVQLTL
jgi:hypothetical protein